MSGDERMSHFEAAIGDVTKNLGTVEQQLELAQAEWIAQIKKFLPDWFRNEARDAVVENPDLATELDQQQISQLKREVGDLAERAASLVDDLVAHGPWPHTARDKDGDVPSPSAIWPAHRSLFQPELGLRKLLWKVYPILRKYGWGDKNLINAGSAEEQYPYALPDQNITAAISSRYIDLCGIRYQMSQKLRQLKLDQKRSEVSKQWDEA
jgi:hypothetical protein